MGYVDMINERTCNFMALMEKTLIAPGSGHDIALAIRRNESLTSLDIRNIPGANTDSVFNSIGSFLLQEECQCRLGFLSCDAFQVTPSQTELVYSKEKEESTDGKPVKELTPGGKVTVTIKSDKGEKRIEALCRIDTANELAYYRHGGILHYVLRKMIGAA